MSEATTSTTKALGTKLPVTVLSGFLGAGKTTLLNYILNDDSHKLKIAVIVNDMSEVNVDAKLVKLGDKKNETSELSKKMIEMSNGCICCTLQPDLMEHVAKLAKEQAFDYLLIESTGISEPLPIAQTFTFDLDYFLKMKNGDGDDEEEQEQEQQEQENKTTTEEETNKESDSGIPNLRDYATLDTMVTVVDCRNFLDDYSSSDSLKSRNMESNETDERSVVNLLADQVEFADVIILNKKDLVDDKELALLKTIIGKMNPDAEILESSFGKVPLNKILNTGKFDMERAMTRSDWTEELEKKDKEGHTPETIEYGITSFVYRSRRPFHPARLAEDFISNEEALENVLRSKGFFWICTKMDKYGLWSQAGDTLRIEAGEHFWAAVPTDHQFDEEEKYEIEKLKLKGLWDEKYGDRRQELVFIGINMEKEKIVSILNSCLLTDEEMKMGEEKWAEFDDPIELEFGDEMEHGDDDDDEGDAEEQEGENGEEQEDDHEHGPGCNHKHHHEPEQVKTILLGNKKRKHTAAGSENEPETKKQKKE